MLIPEGYPEGYRLGFELYLWFIGGFLGLVFGIYFLIKVFKSPLVNRKELYLGNGIFFIAVGLGWILYELGFIFSINYAIFDLLHSAIINGSVIIFFYLWEKNLMKMKFKPVILVSIWYFVTMGISIYFYIINFEAPYLGLIILGGIILISFFLYSLFIRFILRISGKLKILGIILTIGMTFYFISIILDSPLVYLFLPKFPPIISPFLLIGSALFFGYTLLGIVDGIIAYYNQTNICTIHRGVLGKNDSFYYCPQCTTPYCSKCYEQIIKREGCWNCGYGISNEQSEEWNSKKIEDELEIIKKEKVEKHKSKK